MNKLKTLLVRNVQIRNHNDFQNARIIGKRSKDSKGLIEIEII